MQNNLDELLGQWQAAPASPQKESITALIDRANAKRLASLKFHYGNIAVLSSVVILVAVFFYLFFPFQDTLSKTGVLIMIASVVIRIIIEAYSSIRSRKIDITAPALSSTDESVRFFSFRKKIHGPVTITIVVLYSIGFFMLTPEFYNNIGLQIYAYDALYCVGAIFLIWKIRKGIRKEMTDLNAVVEMRKQFSAGL